MPAGAPCAMARLRMYAMSGLGVMVRAVTTKRKLPKVQMALYINFTLYWRLFVAVIGKGSTSYRHITLSQPHFE